MFISDLRIPLASDEANRLNTRCFCCDNRRKEQ